MVLNPGPSSAVALRIQTAATLRYETDGLHIDQSEAFLWCLKLATTSLNGTRQRGGRFRAACGLGRGQRKLAVGAASASVRLLARARREAVRLPVPERA